MKSVFIKRFITVVIVAFILGGGIYSGTYYFLKDGEAWVVGENAIRSSSDVSKKFGKVNSVTMSFSGFSYSLRGGNEKVQLKSNVEGENLIGSVYLHLSREQGGQWVVDSIYTP